MQGMAIDLEQWLGSLSAGLAKETLRKLFATIEVTLGQKEKVLKVKWSRLAAVRGRNLAIFASFSRCAKLWCGTVVQTAPGLFGYSRIIVLSQDDVFL